MCKSTVRAVQIENETMALSGLDLQLWGLDFWQPLMCCVEQVEIEHALGDA